MARDILIVGLSHRTAPIAVRERLAFPQVDLQPALARLAGLDGVHEAAIVSTCNRVEVVACVAEDARARGLDTRISEFLAAERNLAQA